ncbi:MFS general substrate transporter [Sarocladium strictum]
MAGQAVTSRTSKGPATETTSLLRPDEDFESLLRDASNEVQDDESENTVSVGALLSVLLIGVFISQADTSLVLATSASIASEFNDFENASWLISSYMLAMCVAQPLFGKLSDIFGRKAMLQVSGICQSMVQLIAARAVQGIGGAGMVCLVSILITDIAPLIEVASYRSYINVVQTVGRSAGGAIGGVLADTIGWRRTLAGQAPITAVGIILIAWKLNLPPRATQGTRPDKDLIKAKLRRIDFAGALSLSTTMLPFLLLLDAGGQKFSWLSLPTGILTAIGLLSGIVFVVAERRWASEPIFPLHLLANSSVLVSYLGIAMQNASQTAIMFLTPLYFQVTQGASAGQAGVYMVPPIIGNMVGGLLTGMLIKRYGRTKWLLISSAVSASLCFTLLICLWHGDTPSWQSIFIFPGGFATAMAHSVIFVIVASSVSEEYMAIAGSGLYLSGSVGGVAGICGVSATFQSGVKRGLLRHLEGSGLPDSSKISKRVLEDVTTIWNLPDSVRELVIRGYVDGFQTSFAVCLGIACICLVLALASREKRLS